MSKIAGVHDLENLKKFNSLLTFTPPSAAFGTITASNIQSRRVGDCLEVRGTFKSGTPGASTALIPMPSGLVIDSAKLSTTSNTSNIGFFVITLTTSAFAAANDIGPMMFDGSDTANVYFTQSASASGTMAKFNGNVQSSNVGYHFEFKVPIVGWK